MHLNLSSSTRDTHETNFTVQSAERSRAVRGLSSSIHSRRVSIVHGFIQLDCFLWSLSFSICVGGCCSFSLTSQYQKTLRTGATSRIRWFNKTVGFFCGNGCSQLYCTPESKFVLESISIWSFQNADSTPRSTAIASR